MSNVFGDILGKHAAANTLRKDAASPVPTGAAFLTGRGNAGAVAWDSEDGFNDWRDDLQASLPCGTGDSYEDSYPHGWIQDICIDGTKCLISWCPAQNADYECYVAGIEMDKDDPDEPCVVGGPADWTQVEQQYVAKAFAGKCPNCGAPMVNAKNSDGDPVKECLSCGKHVAKGALAGLFSAGLEAIQAAMERGTLYDPPTSALAKAFATTPFAKAASPYDFDPGTQPEIVFLDPQTKPSFAQAHGVDDDTAANAQNLMKALDLGEADAAAAITLAKAAVWEEAVVKAADGSEKVRPGAIPSGPAKGSYPITDAASLEDAVQAYGRAKFPGIVKQHIIAAAKKLGLVSKLPDSWNVKAATA